MPHSPNKLSNFWQELRRRRVVHVIVVYASAAFVIIELVNNIYETLNLPEWTPALTLIILAIGFPLAIIFSWIFDVTPEGIEKTKPLADNRKDQKTLVPNSWKIATYVSVVIIFGLIAFNIFWGKRGPGIDESLAKSIAVLPFHNYSGDSGQDYMCEGLTDEIISHLFKVTSFDEVRSLTSVLPFKESKMSAIEIADALKVNYILEGSYKKMGDELRITAQLIESKSDKHVWLKDYDLPYEEIMGIPGEIALQIAEHLKAFISGEEEELIRKTPTLDLDAYEYYKLGKHLVYNREREDELWQAIEYYQEAISKDPEYALAYSGMAEAYYQFANMAVLSPKEAYPNVKEYSMKALELNEELADPHVMLALVKQSYEYDFEGAEKEYLKALEINPGNHSVHLYYAMFLTMMRRFDEALTYSATASKLDPITLNTISVEYVNMFMGGYRDEALELMEEFRDTHPENTWGYWFCAVFYADLERYEEAIHMLQTDIALMEEDNASDEIGLLGYLYGKTGQPDKANDQLVSLDELASEGYYIAPRTHAWIYMGLDQVDKAVEILRQAVDEHLFDPLYMQIYPNSYVNSDPRFIELQKYIGLPE